MAIDAPSMSAASPRLRVTRRRHPITASQDVGHLEWADVSKQSASLYTGEPVHLAAGCNVVVTLEVTELVGSLDVTIETAESNDAKVTWRRFGAFTSAHGPTRERLCLACSDEFVRLVATPGEKSDQIASYVVRATVVGI